MAWLSDWAKRVKLTIDNGDITAGLANFPMLLYLSTSSGRGPDDISFIFDELGSDANRKKIAVTTSDGETQCYVEIEKWDHGSEKAWLWVKVPSIASDADTDLYLYYDSNKAENTTYVGDCADGSAATHAVWDSDFKMVHHMRDDTTSIIRDSTENNNDGTKRVANQPLVSTAGQIADAQSFDGFDDFVNCGSSASLKGMAALTIEVWHKSAGGARTFVDLSNGSSDRCYRWGTFSDECFYPLLGNGNWFYTALTDIEAAVDAWEHAVLVYDGVLLKIYTAGAEIWSDDTAELSIGTTTSDLWIGRKLIGGHVNGLIDEVRISAIGRTPAWIKASYECQVDDLLLWGSEETEAPPAGNPWYCYAQQQ